MKKIFIALLIGFGVMMNVFAANTAALAAGGISIAKTPGIILQHTEITINQNTVKVAYVFNNTSNDDVNVPIHFILPQNFNVVPYQHDVNPINLWGNFSARVQGQTISTNTAVVATMNDRDVTSDLQNAGIPIDPSQVSNNVNTDLVTLHTWQTKAKQLNLMDKNNRPLWQQQTSYSWQQTFPTHRPILVEIEYNPQVGMFTIPVADVAGKNLSSVLLPSLQDTFDLNLADLIDGDKMLTWLQDQVNLSQNASSTLSFVNVNYQFINGLSWMNPLKNMTVTIMKSKNGMTAYNRFYGKEAVKASDTPEFVRIFMNQFTPATHIVVLYSNIGTTPANIAGTKAANGTN